MKTHAICVNVVHIFRRYAIYTYNTIIHTDTTLHMVDGYSATVEVIKITLYIPTK